VPSEKIKRISRFEIWQIVQLTDTRTL